MDEDAAACHDYDFRNATFIITCKVVTITVTISHRAVFSTPLLGLPGLLSNCLAGLSLLCTCSLFVSFHVAGDLTAQCTSDTALRVGPVHPTLSGMIPAAKRIQEKLCLFHLICFKTKICLTTKMRKTKIIHIPYVYV